MNFKEMWYETLLVLLLIVYSFRVYLGLQSRKKAKAQPGLVLRLNVPHTVALESERHRVRARLRELDESISSLEGEIAHLTTIVKDSVEARQLHWLEIDEKNTTLDRLRGHRETVKEILEHIDV